MNFLYWSFGIAMAPIILKWLKVHSLSWIWTLIPAILLALFWGILLYFFLVTAK